MTPNLVKGSNSLPSDRNDDPNHPRNNPAFQPDLLKKRQAEQSNQQDMSTGGGMDGDHAAKTMDAGANAATNATEMSDGIHEDAKTSTGFGQKETGGGTSLFSKDGAIGSAFTAQGAIGGLGEKVGGPLSSQGMIGKNFNPDGAIGGTFQRLAEKNEKH